MNRGLPPVSSSSAGLWIIHKAIVTACCVTFCGFISTRKCLNLIPIGDSGARSGKPRAARFRYRKLSIKGIPTAPGLGPPLSAAVPGSGLNNLSDASVARGLYCPSPAYGSATRGRASKAVHSQAQPGNETKGATQDSRRRNARCQGDFCRARLRHATGSPDCPAPMIGWVAPFADSSARLRGLRPSE
jgi:hypothetical protein